MKTFIVLASRTVCGSSKCSTIARIAMVRRIAWFSSQKSDRSIDTGGTIRLHVSRLQHDLHVRTKFGKGKIHEKTIRQIHHSFDQLCDILEYASCSEVNASNVECRPIDIICSYLQCSWARHHNDLNIWHSN